MRKFGAFLLAGCMMVSALAVTPAMADEVTIDWFSDVAGWGPANWNGTDTSPLLDKINTKMTIIQ